LLVVHAAHAHRTDATAPEARRPRTHLCPGGAAAHRALCARRPGPDVLFASNCPDPSAWPLGTEKNENAWFDLLVGETYETGRKFSAAPVGPPLLTRMRVRAQPKKTNFENFGRNSRYLRIPGNRLCPRAKRGRPASAATPKAQITDFAEVSPGFYYRPQRIMDSVPFCGVPKSR
jgi:hypothetical protein